MATVRASKPMIAAAQPAEKIFTSMGTAAAGIQRNGRVNNNTMGLVISGCQIQPETRATVGRLSMDTHRFKVQRYSKNAAAAKIQGRSRGVNLPRGSF
jgi:hypothetical protein